MPLNEFRSYGAADAELAAAAAAELAAAAAAELAAADAMELATEPSTEPFLTGPDNISASGLGRSQRVAALRPVDWCKPLHRHAADRYAADRYATNSCLPKGSKVEMEGQGLVLDGSAIFQQFGQYAHGLLHNSPSMTTDLAKEQFGYAPLHVEKAWFKFQPLKTKTNGRTPADGWNGWTPADGWGVEPCEAVDSGAFLIPKSDPCLMYHDDNVFVIANRDGLKQGGAMSFGHFLAIPVRDSTFAYNAVDAATSAATHWDAATSAATHWDAATSAATHWDAATSAATHWDAARAAAHSDGLEGSKLLLEKTRAVAQKLAAALVHDQCALLREYADDKNPGWTEHPLTEWLDGCMKSTDYTIEVELGASNHLHPHHTMHRWHTHLYINKIKVTANGSGDILEYDMLTDAGYGQLHVKKFEWEKGFCYKDVTPFLVHGNEETTPPPPVHADVRNRFLAPEQDAKRPRLDLKPG